MWLEHVLTPAGLPTSYLLKKQVTYIHTYMICCGMVLNLHSQLDWISHQGVLTSLPHHAPT